MFVDQCSFYNSKEGASGIISAVDITTVGAFSNLFKSPHDIGVARRVVIRTDAAITVRFNKSTNDGISVSAAEGVLEIGYLGVSAIFITAASSANLKIIVAR